MNIGVYNRLFTKILDSSIWLEPSTTRIVWITLLAAMDEDGYAHFSAIENLAGRARVTKAEAQKAVDCFLAPDPNSENSAHEGRRVERVPGGFFILNAEEHRKLLNREIRREQTRLRVARHRSKNSGNIDSVTGALLDVTPSSASVSEIDWSKNDGFSGITEKDREAWATAYPACNLERQLASMHQWLLANPLKAKKSNWRKFVTNWLCKQQDRGGDQHGSNRKNNATNRNEGTLNAGRHSAFDNVGKV